MSREVEAPEYEEFAVKIVTRQGYRLAAGGICLAGFSTAWEHTFNALADLVIEEHTLLGIDDCLARALTALGDETLILAGASLNAGDLPEGRTGGVLGSPRETIQSADGSCDDLPDGFSLWAAPGGPGLAARGTEEQMLYRKLLENGLDTGLLVLDGTGRDAHGFFMAFANGAMKYEFTE